MTRLFYPLKSSRNYGYESEICWDEAETDIDLYRVGARDVKPFKNWFRGEVYLDQVVDQYVEVWTPKLVNPFATRTEIQKVGLNQFQERKYKLDGREVMRGCGFEMNIAPLVLIHGREHSDDFDDFAQRLNDCLVEHKGFVMKDTYIELLFEKLYDYYRGKGKKVENLIEG